MNGRSQAVRLPKEFRIEGDEVAVTRLGNAIMLQPIKKTWPHVYKAMQALEGEFPEREDLPSQTRDFFK